MRDRVEEAVEILKHWKPVAEASALNSESPLDKQLRSRTRYATTLRVLGSAMYSLSRDEEAVVYMEEAMRLDPDHIFPPPFLKIFAEAKKQTAEKAKHRQPVILSFVPERKMIGRLFHF